MVIIYYACPIHMWEIGQLLKISFWMFSFPFMKNRSSTEESNATSLFSDNDGQSEPWLFEKLEKQMDDTVWESDGERDKSYPRACDARKARKDKSSPHSTQTGKPFPFFKTSLYHDAQTNKEAYKEDGFPLKRSVKNSDMTCPHCGQVQYRTRKSARKAGMLNLFIPFIAIAPLLFNHVLLGFVVYASCVGYVAISLIPYFIDFQEKDPFNEPLW